MATPLPARLVPAPYDLVAPAGFNATANHVDYSAWKTHNGYWFRKAGWLRYRSYEKVVSETVEPRRILMEELVVGGGAGTVQRNLK